MIESLFQKACKSLKTSTIAVRVVSWTWGVKVYACFQEHDYEIRVSLCPDGRREIEIVLFVRSRADLPSGASEEEYDLGGIDRLTGGKVADGRRATRRRKSSWFDRRSHRQA